MAAAITFIIALVTFRLVAGMGGEAWMKNMANFSPMAAVVLCGAVLFPRRWAIAVPLAALLISDVALNLHAELAPMTTNTVSILLAFGLVFWIGTALRRNHKGQQLRWLLAGSLAGSVIFFTITNSSVWLMTSTSVYPRTIEGWIQCMTVGTPGFPPSYLFFRNSLVGDLFFTAVIWGILAHEGKKRTHSAQLRVSTGDSGVDSVRST